MTYKLVRREKQERLRFGEWSWVGLQTLGTWQWSLSGCKGKRASRETKDSKTRGKNHIYCVQLRNVGLPVSTAVRSLMNVDGHPTLSLFYTATHVSGIFFQKITKWETSALNFIYGFPFQTNSGRREEGDISASWDLNKDLRVRVWNLKTHLHCRPKNSTVRGEAVSQHKVAARCQPQMSHPGEPPPSPFPPDSLRVDHCCLLPRSLLPRPHPHCLQLRRLLLSTALSLPSPSSLSTPTPLISGRKPNLLLHSESAGAPWKAPPQPRAQVQSWAAGRVRLRCPQVRKAQRKNWKLNEHKILGVAVTISFSQTRLPTGQSRAGTVMGIADRYGGVPLDHPERHGHLHFRVMPLYQWLGYDWCRFFWGATLKLPSGTCSLVVHRLSCPEACVILVPQPVIKPTSPALEGRFLTTGPSGKVPRTFGVRQIYI